jgi:two-component system chemotaxis response regulator CheY
LKILIVDDDVVSRMVLMHLIDSACGGRCELLEAEDGEDAWAQLEAGAAPEALFCDLRMPRLSGMELLARVKADARFAALPFVLGSAAGDAATMEQALLLGAAGYIVKPFDAARVEAQLARLRGRDEAPQATARRLGIDGARLQIYLGGLQRQLDGADVDALLADGQPDAARVQLQRLGEGCRTLGLLDAADALAALAADPGVDGARAAHALGAAREAVLRQLEAARRLAG